MTKSKITEKAIQQLINIGFTQLESEIYLYLLSQGQATGYAIAKGIGKPVANVYKAAESLVNKGGIEHIMDESKLYIAVSWKSLLAAQQQKFETNMNLLSESLRDYPEYQDDEHVYQLKNVQQVIERTTSMIEQAEYVILADIEPDAIVWFASSLLKAVERGVDVRIKVYQPLELEGVSITYRKKGHEVYAKTRDVQFTLCADGKETMIALLNEGTDVMIQAFRTKSALMNMSFYCGLLYELILTDLKDVIPKGNIKAAQNILNNTKHLHPFSNENVVFQSYKQRYSNKRT